MYPGRMAEVEQALVSAIWGEAGGGWREVRSQDHHQRVSRSDISLKGSFQPRDHSALFSFSDDLPFPFPFLFYDGLRWHGPSLAFSPWQFSREEK